MRFACIREVSVKALSVLCLSTMVLSQNKVNFFWTIIFFYTDSTTRLISQSLLSLECLHGVGARPCGFCISKPSFFAIRSVSVVPHGLILP